MNEYEIIYGIGRKTELDVLRYLIDRLSTIEAVVDIKGLDIIKIYLCERAQELQESE